MGEIYEIAQQTKYRFLGIDEAYKMKRTKLVMDEMHKLANFLRSLNMNTAEFAPSQLYEHKLCVTSASHADVVALVVRVVCVCLLVWYV